MYVPNEILIYKWKKGYVIIFTNWFFLIGESLSSLKNVAGVSNAELLALSCLVVLT